MNMWLSRADMRTEFRGTGKQQSALDFSILQGEHQHAEKFRKVTAEGNWCFLQNQAAAAG